MKSLLFALLAFLLIFGGVYAGSQVVGALGSLVSPSIFLGVIGGLIAYYWSEKQG